MDLSSPAGKFSILLAGMLITEAALSAESNMSAPPDTNAYTRSLVDDDFIGGGGAVSTEIFVVDAVVDNTDPNLANTDDFNDGETSIAINPANPNEIVVTTFAERWGANAPLWHTTNGGLIWTKRFTIPAPPGQAVAGCPCDQVLAYGREGRLSGAFLATNIFTGTTTNPANAGNWLWHAPGGTTQRTNIHSQFSPDQPWALVVRDTVMANQDNVYVAYDDFPGQPAVPNVRVSVALNTNPPNFTRDVQVGTSTLGVNPGHRLAVDPRNGFVYSLFQRCTANCGVDQPKTINYMLNRSVNGGANWILNSQATGIVVATGVSTQPRPKFGTVNALLGGVLHGAVDPTNGDVYYVYGDRDAQTGNDRLSVRRLTDNGGGGLTIGAAHFVTVQVEAALPSVAVSTDGTVGVFYYTFDGVPNIFPVFTAHLAVSTDHGVNFVQHNLLTFASSAQDSGNSRQRVLGDYMQMKAIGRIFYGAFTGNGALFGRNVANHDPIFFRTSLDFIRGDANNDGRVDIADGIYINGWLFYGGPAPVCMDAADANDDGGINLSDQIYLNTWLLMGGPAPPAPGPYTCGSDPTPDNLFCDNSTCD